MNKRDNIEVCHRTGCGRKTKIKYQAVLILHPPFWVENKTPEKKFSNVRVCKLCCPLIKAEDLITDEWWQRIVESAFDNGKAAPVREMTTIEFIRS